MSDDRTFYQVISQAELLDIRLPDHLEQGYEDGRDYRRAVRNIVERWHDRVGEAVGERHGFFLLRFHDTPGGLPDEEWLPQYLLKPADMPDYLIETESSDGTGGELMRAFGFD